MTSKTDLVQRFGEIWGRIKLRDRYLLGGVLLLGIVVVLCSGMPAAKKNKTPSSSKQTVVTEAALKTSAYFLSDEIDQKAYVKRLENQYFSIQEKNQAMERAMEEVRKNVDASRLWEEEFRQKMDEVELRLKEMVLWSKDKNIDAAASVISSAMDVRKYQMDVISVSQKRQGSRDDLYLPAGSFVKATLLTGVFAPADVTNPLPVLIRLDEAFYGPNETRIPLKGAFAVGKASGELNSERALVQISTLSSVLESGEAFEHKGNIGYLTDEGGQLGMKGVLVHNTGRQMSVSFLTGFMGGASQALADSQTALTTTDEGKTVRNLTGSRSKNAAFEGLAQSAAQMSKYYSDQLERIVPAVKVEPGVKVYLVVLEGVVIHGFKRGRASYPGNFD